MSTMNPLLVRQLTVLLVQGLPPNGGDKMILGMGRNRGKKMAKNDAAKEALKKLLALKVFEQKDVKYAHYQLPAN